MSGVKDWPLKQEDDPLKGAARYLHVHRYQSFGWAHSVLGLSFSENLMPT